MSASSAKNSKPVSQSKSKSAGTSSGPSPAVMPTYARANLVFERGEGAWLISTDGDRYLDFGSGVAVNALGHAHPKLIDALTQQANKVWHTSNLYRVTGQERLAEQLCEVTFADTVFFCNSGAEACEGAIKVARRYHYVNGRPERWRLITFKGGFDIVPFGDLEAAEKAIGPETAGIMVEPVQGEGGVNVASSAWLKSLRELCDKHGLLLVLDEVQTGMGRTGKLFAHEWAGFTPDVMAVAKGLGGGFPIGAVLATKEAAKGMVAGTHGSTFGGNPLATAVGAAVLEAVLEPGFLEHVQTMSLRFKQQLARLKDEYPHVIEEVRGSGLLMGIKVKPPYGDVVNACADEKLLTVGAGDNVVRLLPPLNVTEQELTEATRRLGQALARLPRPA
jgi:acetylornithine/N-succinyldiaminopimelate aminotransferase